MSPHLAIATTLLLLAANPARALADDEADYVASRRSREYHLTADCLDARAIGAENLVKGRDAKSDRVLHADCPRLTDRKLYPDFGYLPPARGPGHYEGRVFRLSQQYPATRPDASRTPEFFKIDFTKDWKGYLMAARAYCFAGNIKPGGDPADDWQVAAAAHPKWFHMPWQHYGPPGREGVHGLTKEAPVQPRQLAWTQTYTGGQTYAVGFFNEFGGYTIGQVWTGKGYEVPPETKNSEFPDGTVICKLLFTDVPTDQVPSLAANPLIWKGYITLNYASESRKISDLALIQMDLMARDPQSPNGWVFGTYQYNGALNRANPWENLVPVGLMWGNDPEDRTNVSNPQPTQTIINPALKQTRINDSAELPPTHLGWNGRLNGPVDNPMSSCMSCHMTASAPQLSQISPLFENRVIVPSSDEWMRWFRNIKCGAKFDEGRRTTPTDFSLQLSMSIQNYHAWRSSGEGLSASHYAYESKPARGKPFIQSPYTVPTHGEQDEEGLQEVAKIRRDFPR